MRVMRYVLPFLLIGSSFAKAQTIQHVKAVFLDGKVTVTYDLTGGKPDQKFALDLYGSHNNFSKPLAKVSGDVGKNITPGVGKKIIWEAAQEFSTYRNDITFKIKGEAMPLPFVVKSPAGGKLKRGKKTIITWDGGKPSQNVKLELFQGATLINAITETTNTGQFTWSIPKKQSKGNYTIKLTADQETVYSPAFKIKAKSPFLFIALPMVAAGGAAAVLLGGGGGSGSKDLPWAPDPD